MRMSISIIDDPLPMFGVNRLGCRLLRESTGMSTISSISSPAWRLPDAGVTGLWTGGPALTHLVGSQADGAGCDHFYADAWSVGECYLSLDNFRSLEDIVVDEQRSVQIGPVDQRG